MLMPVQYASVLHSLGYARPPWTQFGGSYKPSLMCKDSLDDFLNLHVGIDLSTNACI